MQIEGHVDLCGPQLVEGWIYADLADNEYITLQVFVGQDLLGECIADRFRQDLCDGGVRDGPLRIFFCCSH